MRVYFTNLGCKLNQAELEDAARRFAAAGYRIASRLDEAEIHVVNTCTVTARAARDSRRAARRGGRLPGRDTTIHTVLTGCHVSLDPAAAAAIEGVDLVVPNEDKEKLVQRVAERFPPRVAPESEMPTPEVPVPYVPLAYGNTRGLVKIEDGCNMRCAFCIIPSTRGRQRSRPAADVVREVASLARAGLEEIVVTGVQISSWRDRDMRLADLTKALVDRTSVRRLRLSSIAPWEFDDRLLAFLEGGRVCRHFHFSLQAGDDEVLRRMHRPYTTERYARLLEAVREVSPEVAVTTDVIVGFPGETEEEFEHSLAFVRSQRFARIHVFPFSPRPGTEAATLPDPVSSTVVKERMRRMLEVADESQLRFRRRAVGRTAEVLWEREREGRLIGTSDHYLKVSAPAGIASTGTSSRVRIIGLADRDRVIGVAA